MDAKPEEAWVPEVDPAKLKKVAERKGMLISFFTLRIASVQPRFTYPRFPGVSSRLVPPKEVVLT